MRTLVALTLYVSLSSAATLGVQPDWRILREQGLAQIDNKEYVAAESSLRASLAAAQSLIQTALSSSDLGVALHNLGKDPAARIQLERALKIWQESAGQQARLGRTAESLGVILRNAGDYSGAENLLRRTLTVAGITVESRAELSNLLGDLFREEGRMAEAGATFRSVLDLPGIPWHAEADAHIGVADLAREARNWEVSFEHWSKVIEIAHDHNDSNVEAIGLRGLGLAWSQNGNRARGEPLLRKSLALFEASVPQNLHQTATTLGGMAEFYIADGKLAMAEEVLLKAIGLDERGLGENHPQVGALLQLLADVQARHHDFEHARRSMDRAMLIMSAKFGEDSVVAGSVWAGRGRIEQAAGNASAAVDDYRKALVLLSTGGPDLEGFRSSVIQSCSEVLKQLHRKGEAKALLSLLPRHDRP